MRYCLSCFCLGKLVTAYPRSTMQGREQDAENPQHPVVACNAPFSISNFSAVEKQFSSCIYSRSPAPEHSCPWLRGLLTSTALLLTILLSARHPPQGVALLQGALDWADNGGYQEPRPLLRKAGWVITSRAGHQPPWGVGEPPRVLGRWHSSHRCHCALPHWLLPSSSRRNFTVPATAV